ncbi:MAG: Purine nucleoside phosphorylase [Desulfotomaculum sp. 46_296]|nr:MAG: Purine nucleoside phosphorylase [Desulfotomaculum sp. 46_296]HAU31583.1 5'-methylthioadenosine phosphorylase [Desulfotomaculum sp.]
MAKLVGIIGGTGIYNAGMLENPQKEVLYTPYGQVSINAGRLHDKEVVFIARHGEDHTVPPHLINHRANIWGLKTLGVKAILAVAAVGSLNTDLKPGEIVLVNQFLDFTRSRPQTFQEKEVLHLDMTAPYCTHLRRLLALTTKQLGLACHYGGTYVCTEGPRFETPAETRMYKSLGGDVIGMTGVPEAVLAREAGICYAAIALITNFAAGISSMRALSHNEVVEAMTQNAANINALLQKTIEVLDLSRACSCQESLIKGHIV